MRYTLLLLALIVTACAPKPNPAIAIQVAVNSTLAAMPTPTSAPLSTPYPTPTPFDLKGLFCEYQFCIGHPGDMAFFDVSAQKNPASPSTYSQGLLASFNGNLFLQLVWQLSPGSSDPSFMLDLILDKNVDTRVGNTDTQLLHDMNVIYTPITTTATPVLPYGAAAAWICGERAFAWKVYSPQADNTQALFNVALDRFTCNR
jgi:hypothetical protein